jgi:SAM-dependent methyltransferase
MVPNTGVNDVPPALALINMINGGWLSQAIAVAAKLNIADLLVGGPQTMAALAEATEAHAGSLHRLLRTLASAGVLAEDEDGRFRLTPIGELLQTRVPGSFRGFARMLNEDYRTAAYFELLDAVKTGEVAFTRAYGMTLFAFLEQHPEHAKRFNEAMIAATGHVALAAVAAYDFSQFRRIVDVGGGNGQLAAAILTAHPNMRGIVFDLATGVEGSSRYLAEAGVADRCQVVAGDFFKSVPSGAGAYLLKGVIHDWDDEHSVKILANCRRAIPVNGKLLIVERVMPARVEATPEHLSALLGDLNVLVCLGGRERTASEFADLLATSGFELRRTLPITGTVSIIEAIPCG